MSPYHPDRVTGRHRVRRSTRPKRHDHVVTDCLPTPGPGQARSAEDGEALARFDQRVALPLIISAVVLLLLLPGGAHSLLVAVGVVFVGAAVGYRAEHATNPGFQTFGDPLRWAIVTLTTVGTGTSCPRRRQGGSTGSVTTEIAGLRAQVERLVEEVARLSHPMTARMATGPAGRRRAGARDGSHRGMIRRVW
jgi:hypothetical protein